MLVPNMNLHLWQWNNWDKLDEKQKDDVVKGFKRTNRGQLIMACGTGKTFTSIWIDQKLKSNMGY